MSRRGISVCLLATTAVLFCAGRPGRAATDGPDNRIDEPVHIAPTAATVAGGQGAEFTVSLLDIAESDRTVALSTDEPGVFVDLPESVVVPSGCSSVTFVATTYGVGTQVVATVTATYGLSTDSTGLTVVP